jgi:hypothetical protein
VWEGVDFQLHSFVVSALSGTESFNSRLLYPSGKICRYLLNRRLGGPQGRPGQFTEQQNVFPLSAIEPRFLGRPVCSLFTTTATPSIFQSRPYKISVRNRKVKNTIYDAVTGGGIILK